MYFADWPVFFVFVWLAFFSLFPLVLLLSCPLLCVLSFSVSVVVFLAVLFACGLLPCLASRSHFDRFLCSRGFSRRYWAKDL